MNNTPRNGGVQVASPPSNGVHYDPTDRLIAKLEAHGCDPQPTGVDAWDSRCPAHEGSRRNLSITRRSDGGTLIHCHHEPQCSPGDVTKAVGLTIKDLFAPTIPIPAKSKARSPKFWPSLKAAADAFAYRNGGNPWSSWSYRSKQGDVVMEIVRFETPKGKTYRPYHRTEDGSWTAGDPVGLLPLYHLPDVPAAGRVYLTEGEKCVDLARDIGVMATTSSHGAGSAKKTDWTPLSGLDVAILLDVGKAGEVYGAEAAELILAAGGNPKVLRLPRLTDDGDDLEQWISLRRSEVMTDAEIRAELDQLADQAEPWTPPKPIANDNGRAEDTIRIEASAEAGDIEDLEIVDRWPKAAPAMFQGIAGEFVQMIAPETEADPAATLFQILAGFGNLIGRGAHFVVGSTKHHTVIPVAIVGATAVGRKGSSGDDSELFLADLDPNWFATRYRSGLSTGEGLVHQVRDPKYRRPTRDEIKKGAFPEDLICEDEGVTDKRLYVVETEMGKVLKVMGRDGNTLGDVIRLTYDGKNLGNLSKNSGCTATAPHITIVGHITKADITKCLTETDIANGFANRFCWVAARRSKELPDGGAMFDLDLRDLRDRGRRARDFACSLGEHRMTFDPQFNKAWRAIYSELSSDQRHVVAGRSEANVKRIACVYALLDESAIVTFDHLQSALACWDYVAATIDFVFGPSLRDPNEVKLLRALKADPAGMTRTQISCDVFKRNIKSKTLALALGNLLTQGAIHSRADVSGPKAVERWFAGRPL